MSTYVRNAIIATLAVVLVAAGAIFLIPRLMEPATFRGDVCAQHAQALRTAQSLVVGARMGTEEKTVREAQYNVLLRDARVAGCESELSAQGFSFADVQGDNNNGSNTTAPASPSQTPTTSPSSAPAADSDKWTPVYYTLMKGKDSDLSYGPAVHAKDAADATEQFWTRHTNDPALLCGNGGEWIDGKGDGIDCTRRLADSKSARDNYLADAKSHVKSVEWVQQAPHWAHTAFMMPVKGTPVMLWQENAVYRHNTEWYYKVTTNDGRVLFYRAECGIQPDRTVPAPKQTPPATETPGSPPRTTVPTETPTTTPTETPTETPTQTPTETPTTTPTETPTQTPTTTPTETPTETPTPTETTVPKDPSKFKTHPAHTPAPAPTQEPNEPKLPPCANGGTRDSNQRCVAPEPPKEQPRQDPPKQTSQPPQAPKSTPTPTRDKPVPTSTDAPKARPTNTGSDPEPSAPAQGPGTSIGTPED